MINPYQFQSNGLKFFILHLAPSFCCVQLTFCNLDSVEKPSMDSGEMTKLQSATMEHYLDEAHSDDDSLEI